jgi:hypothetical protein
MEVLGEVQHPGPDVFVNRVPFSVSRLAQGHNQDFEAPRLERMDFLRDESLGQPRIPFQDEGNAVARGTGHGYPMRDTTGKASLSAGSIQGETRLATLVSPSRSPGTTTSEGLFCRGSARKAAAMIAGS